MKKELKAFLIRTKEKIKRNAGTILACATAGFVVKGCADGICAYREIKAHNKWTDNIELPTFNHNVEVARADQERINSLEEKVNELMEKAVKETEGKEEESE